MTTQFRIELPEDQAEQLAALASLRDTTPEALLAEAARALLAGADLGPLPEGEAFEAWIAEGLADEAAGRTVSWEEAMAEVDAIIASAKARRG